MFVIIGTDLNIIGIFNCHNNRTDAERLTNFIKQFIRYGDAGKVIFEIDNGKIKPSKNLADKLLSMLHGNEEFIMIDDQKLVYETALDLTLISSDKDKHVGGGPQKLDNVLS